jgi:hypothetical protein
MSKRLKVAIIGPGNWDRSHGQSSAPELDLRMMAVSSPSPKG